MYASESKFTVSQLTLKIHVYALFFIIRSFLDPESDFVVAFLVHPGKSFSSSNCRNGERNSILHLNLLTNTPTPASPLSINGDTSANSININSNNTTRDSDITNNLTAFSLIASLAATCILESEMKKDALRADGSQTPSSAANWIDDRSAYAVQSALDQIELKVVIFLIFFHNVVHLICLLMFSCLLL